MKPKQSRPKTRTLRAYEPDHARITAYLQTIQSERPSTTLPDIVRELCDKAGLAEPEPIRRRRKA